jgi:hypothetical protein
MRIVLPVLSLTLILGGCGVVPQDRPQRGTIKQSTNVLPPRADVRACLADLAAS